MANVVKKHSISSELAQEMMDKAVAKATELGASENVVRIFQKNLYPHCPVKHHI
jgi:hypothetical protein